jgi:hypothetical protein
VDKHRNQPGHQYSPVDGIKRRAKDEAELDELAVSVFARGGGKQFLQYLRSITIEMVGGPEVTDAQLRHREGARYLVAVIEGRVSRGRTARSKVTTEEKTK